MYICWYYWSRIILIQVIIHLGRYLSGNKNEIPFRTRVVLFIYLFKGKKKNLNVGIENKLKFPVRNLWAQWAWGDCFWNSLWHNNLLPAVSRIKINYQLDRVEGMSRLTNNLWVYIKAYFILYLLWVKLTPTTFSQLFRIKILDLFSKNFVSNFFHSKLHLVICTICKWEKLVARKVDFEKFLLHLEFLF